jgi:hypothetical protein
MRGTAPSHPRSDPARDGGSDECRKPIAIAKPLVAGQQDDADQERERSEHRKHGATRGERRAHAHRLGDPGELDTCEPQLLTEQRGPAAREIAKQPAEPASVLASGRHGAS